VSAADLDGAIAMTNSAPGAEGGAGSRFEYFMVRLRWTGDAPGELSGQIERLGSGEKRTFDTGVHLLELVAKWPGPDRKVQP
jgi:hypothetical protein